MDIEINIEDTASSLAHEIVCAKFLDDETLIYESADDTITSYSKEAQELFNDWFEYYSALLFNHKIN
jgi:hypothetical protein